MENYNDPQPFSNYTVLNSEQSAAVAPKKFMATVFLWMFVALGISALCAFWFASTPSLLTSLINETGKGLSGLGYIVMLAPVGFVLAMSVGFQRFSVPVLLFLFLAYSAITGISFSFILLAYTASSIMGTFITASAMFGIMAVMGYTTDKDLTSFGRILMMAVFGLVIAMLVNWFLHSDTMGYIISIIGVAVFTGLTAYDVQKLKRIGTGMQFEGVGATDTNKAAIMGALSLYLDFINLFLFLIRLFGRRK